MASKGASLRRRRLRRRAAFVPAGRGFRCGHRGLPFQRGGVWFTNVIANCKLVQRPPAPVKYYGGLPPSLLGYFPPGRHPRPACPLAPVRPLRGFPRRRRLRRPQASRQGKPLPPGRSGGAPLHAQRQPSKGAIIGRGRETPCTIKNAYNSHLTPTFTKLFLYLPPLATTRIPLREVPGTYRQRARHGNQAAAWPRGVTLWPP